MEGGGRGVGGAGSGEMGRCWGCRGVGGVGDCGGWGARVERVGVGVRWDGAEGDLFLNEASDRLKALHVFELVGI